MDILTSLHHTGIDTLYSLLIIIVLISAYHLASLFVYKKRKAKPTNEYEILSSSPLAPQVSIVIPCFNQGKEIINRIDSFLNINYQNYEIVIVNNGSTDDSLERLKSYFNLFESSFYYLENGIHTQKVKGVYKSSNKYFSKLRVVDKCQGRMSDVKNVGLITSKADCILLIDSSYSIHSGMLCTAVQKFIESDRDEIIAVLCETWQLEEKSMFSVQHFQSFMDMRRKRFLTIQRLIIKTINGILRGGKHTMLSVSHGKITIYNRRVAIDSGGFSHVHLIPGEELVCRMKALMINTKQNFRITKLAGVLAYSAPLSSNTIS